ncbi:MAG: hypothetical protein RSA90_04235 [Lachnospiraceae bacterium]
MKSKKLMYMFLGVTILCTVMTGCQKIKSLIKGEKKKPTVKEWVTEEFENFNETQRREMVAHEVITYPDRVEDHTNSYVLDAKKGMVMSTMVTVDSATKQETVAPSEYYVKERRNTYSYKEKNGVYKKKRDAVGMYNGIARSIMVSLRNCKSIEDLGTEPLATTEVIKVKVIYGFDRVKYLEDVGITDKVVQSVSGFSELLDNMEKDGYMETIYWFDVDSRALLKSEENLTSYQQFVYYYQLARYGTDTGCPTSVTLVTDYKTHDECQEIVIPEVQ